MPIRQPPLSELRIVYSCTSSELRAEKETTRLSQNSSSRSRLSFDDPSGRFGTCFESGEALFGLRQGWLAASR